MIIILIILVTIINSNVTALISDTKRQKIESSNDITLNAKDY